MTSRSPTEPTVSKAIRYGQSQLIVTRDFDKETMLFGRWTAERTYLDAVGDTVWYILEKRICTSAQIEHGEVLIVFRKVRVLFSWNSSMLLCVCVCVLARARVCIYVYVYGVTVYVCVWGGGGGGAGCPHTRVCTISSSNFIQHRSHFTVQTVASPLSLSLSLSLFFSIW